jgi:hypothetical protein
LHDHVLNVTATREGGLRIAGSGPSGSVLQITAPKDMHLLSTEGVAVEISGD